MKLTSNEGASPRLPRECSWPARLTVGLLSAATSRLCNASSWYDPIKSTSLIFQGIAFTCFCASEPTLRLQFNDNLSAAKSSAAFVTSVSDLNLFSCEVRLIINLHWRALVASRAHALSRCAT